jgi:hypothetical protein
MSHDGWSDNSNNDPIRGLRKMVADPRASVTTLRQIITRYPEMELYVIDNPSASDTLLREIVDREKGSRLRVKTSKIAKLPTASVRLLDHIYNLETIMPSEVYTSLAQNPNLPEHIMLKMIEDGRSACYDILLENPKTSSSVLDRFIELRFKSITLDALAHPNISHKTLERMSNSDHLEIVEFIASNSNTSQELLEKIMERDTKLQNFVIENPNISMSLLEQIDYEEIYPNSIRRMLVSKNPSKSVVTKIAKSQKYQVFSTVYNHPDVEVSDILEGIDRFKKFNVEFIFTHLYKNRKHDMKTFFAKEYNLDISDLSYEMMKDLLGIETKIE